VRSGGASSSGAFQPQNSVLINGSPTQEFGVQCGLL